jgi:hypothetical protein
MILAGFFRGDDKCLFFCFVVALFTSFFGLQSAGVTGVVRFETSCLWAYPPFLLFIHLAISGMLIMMCREW